MINIYYGVLLILLFYVFMRLLISSINVIDLFTGTARTEHFIKCIVIIINCVRATKMAPNVGLVIAN